MKEFIFYCGDDFIKTAKSIHNAISLSSDSETHRVTFKMAGEQNFATRYSGKINTTVAKMADDTGSHHLLISGVETL